MRASVREMLIDLLTEYVGVDLGILELIRDQPASGVNADRSVCMTNGLQVEHAVEVADVDDLVGYLDRLRRRCFGHLDTGVAALYGSELAPIALLTRVELAPLRCRVPGRHHTRTSSSSSRIGEVGGATACRADRKSTRL